MGKNENKTIQIIKNGLQESYPNSFYEKIPDVGYSNNRKTGFNVKRPFDIFHCYQGSTVAIEAKTVKYPNKFKFSDVKDHQIDGLINMAKNQNIAMVAINLWKPRNINIIYFIDIWDFLHWKNTWKTDVVNWDIFLKGDDHISFELTVINNKVNFNGTYLHYI